MDITDFFCSFFKDLKIRIFIFTFFFFFISLVIPKDPNDHAENVADFSKRRRVDLTSNEMATDDNQLEEPSIHHKRLKVHLLQKSPSQQKQVKTTHSALMLKTKRVEELDLEPLSSSDMETFISPERQRMGQHLKKLANKTTTLIRELKKIKKYRHNGEKEGKIHSHHRNENGEAEKWSGEDMGDGEEEGTDAVGRGKKKAESENEGVQEEVKPEAHAETNVADEEMIEGIKQHQSGNNDHSRLQQMKEYRWSIVGILMLQMQ